MKIGYWDAGNTKYALRNLISALRMTFGASSLEMTHIRRLEHNQILMNAIPMEVIIVKRKLVCEHIITGFLKLPGLWTYYRSS
jgi:hypothetical protein